MSGSLWRTAALVVLSASLAPAQEDRATVRLYGRALFAVGPAGQQPAPDRARQIERRLSAIADSDNPVRRAQIEREGGARLVTLDRIVVVTVTAADADENLVTVDELARQWATAVDTALARVARDRAQGWSGFVLRVSGAFRTAFGRLADTAAGVIPGVVAAAVVVFVFALLAKGTRRLTRSLTERYVADPTTQSLVRQTSYYAVWALAVVVAAGALGFAPSTVVTGLGLTSLALGFALKDILSNFVSGVLLLWLRPFQLGDQIVVGATEGSVERIELRATRIRTYDGRIVHVPNAEIFTSRVTNNTAAPVRQASVSVYLGYDQDLRRAREMLDETMRSSPGVLDRPPTLVWVQELTPNEIKLELRFWTDSRRVDFATAASTVRERVVIALREAGFSLPNPSLRMEMPVSPPAPVSAIESQ